MHRRTALSAWSVIHLLALCAPCHAATDLTAFAPIGHALQGPNATESPVQVGDTPSMEAVQIERFSVPVAVWGIELPAPAPIPYRSRDTIVVNTAAATGNGNDIISFGDAINRANAAGGDTTITFGGSVNWNTAVIGPNFPRITANNVTILGGFNGNNPRIQIGGASNLDGIVIAGNNCLVEGLYISSFGRGMVVTGSSNIIRSCTFGANNRDGIEINGANNMIGPGIIANSNTRFGIIIAGAGATGNTILNSQAAFNSNPATACGLGITGGASNNTIGPGALFAANGSEGVVIQGGAHDNTFTQCGIGQNLAPVSTAYPNGHNGVGISAFNGPPVRNRFVDCSIGGNGWGGVFITGVDCNGHTFERCRIGTSPNGLVARPNGQHGITFADGAKENTVGPDCVISGNGWAGIAFYGNAGSTERNAVLASIIGLSGDQSAALPNGQQGVAIFSVAATGNPSRDHLVGQSNVISGNTGDGIFVNGEAALSNTIIGNAVGTSRDRSTLWPNRGRALAVANGAQAIIRGLDNHFAGGIVGGPNPVPTVRVYDGAKLRLSDEVPTIATIGGAGPSGTPTPAQRRLEVLPGAEDGTNRPGWIELAGAEVESDEVVLMTRTVPMPPSETTRAMLTGAGFLNTDSVVNQGLIRVEGASSPRPEPMRLSSVPICRSQLWMRNDFAQGPFGTLKVRVGEANRVSTSLGWCQAWEFLTCEHVFYAAGAWRAGGVLELDPDVVTFDIADRFILSMYPAAGSRFEIVRGLPIDDDKFFVLHYLEAEEASTSNATQALQLVVLETPRNVVSSGRMTASGTPVSSAIRPGLLVVTHGTISSADRGSGFLEIAEAMYLHAARDEWAVATMDWSTEACDQPIDTAEIAMDIGESLVQWMHEVGLGQYQAVHAMGHSSGSWLADGIVDQWKRQHPAAWTHLTVWDAFNTILRGQPGRPYPVLGETANYADHFVHMSGLGLYAFGTNDVLPNCVNVELSYLPEAITPSCFLDPFCSHAFPYKPWYRHTAEYPADYSYQGSRLGYRNSAVYRGLSVRPRFERDLQRGVHLVVAPNGVILRRLPTWTIQFRPSDLPADVSPTGTVVINPDDVMLYTGSPVWIDLHVATDQPANWIRYRFQFLTSTSGTLTTTVDGESVLEASDAFQAGALASVDTGKLRTQRDLHPGVHTVRIRVDPAGVEQVVVRIADLSMGYDEIRPICIADVDDGSGTGTIDGGVTIDDLLYYLGLYEAGLLGADVDDGQQLGIRDDGVTIDDLLYFLQRYSAGC